MRLEERYDDEDGPEPPWHRPGVDGAWLRNANPNTVDGELQNLAAFGSGLTRLTGPRRHAARLIVALVLLGFVLAIVATVVAQVRGR
ncbi:MAG: hypothetical protein ACTHMS_14800 [Jatrophihabitans sp.]|uniref:hypothetical protein n=1 Tax=Jatrophihabitans sp. TaxID=1932789 RepID=UPI003F7DFF23